jgi:regulatory protein
MPAPSTLNTLIYNKALSLLSRREHSRHELLLKLRQRFPEQEPDIHIALTELERKKYLVDQRFAETLARHRAQQGYGPNYIKQELRSHQVMLDENYFQTADMLEAFFSGWQRKFKTRFRTIPQTTLERAKLLRYFLQRGYWREQVEEFLTLIK